MGLIFNSCSTNQVTENESADFMSKSISNYQYVVTYGKIQSAANKEEDVKLYFNSNLYNEITYTGALNYNTTEFANKFRVENSEDNNEFFEIVNVTRTTINSSAELIKFDVTTSDGGLYKGLEYEYDTMSIQNRACPWCWVAGVVISIVDAAVELGSETECQTAVNTCVEAGGLPSATIEEGLFSFSCSVTCNRK